VNTKRIQKECKKNAKRMQKECKKNAKQMRKRKVSGMEAVKKILKIKRYFPYPNSKAEKKQ